MGPGQTLGGCYDEPSERKGAGPCQPESTRTTVFASSIPRTGSWKSPTRAGDDRRLQHPSGVAFVLVSTDESCPDPAEVADRRSRRCARSIPTSTPSRSWRRSATHSRHRVTTSSSSPSTSPMPPRIRCFRTSDRTILVLRPVDGSRRDRPRRPRPTACSVDRRDGGLIPECVDATVRNFASTGVSEPVVRARLPRSRNAAICSKQRFAAHVDDVDVLCAGDVEPAGRRGEGIGQAACFGDRDERVVGSVDDHGRAATFGAESIGPGPIERHARQLAGAAGDEPGQELGEREPRFRSTTATDDIEVDHG